MKSVYMFALLLAVSGLFCGALSADPFQALGLSPAACVITDHSMTTLEEAREILKRCGARALHILPPDVIFGRFPKQLDESDL
ncbi:MAG: hypothetical protein KAX38_07790, partial [Candidatus Krumholzibacteria bacterium]|nr:hypothetical protein [Candidatus Krumholzibacteria bacterium]